MDVGIGLYINGSFYEDGRIVSGETTKIDTTYIVDKYGTYEICLEVYGIKDEITIEIKPTLKEDLGLKVELSEISPLTLLISYDEIPELNKTEAKLLINNEDKTTLLNENQVEYVIDEFGKYEIGLQIDETKVTKTIEINGQLVAEKLNWDLNKVDIRTEGTTIIPIPKGFEVSREGTEDEVSEGLVIKDGANEFVWIPVADSSSYAEDSFGPLTKTNSVTTYTAFDSQEALNHFYGMQEDGTTPYYNYADFTYATDKTNVETSIQTYGGFYVGRYETTIDGTTIGVEQGKTVLTAATLLKTGTNTTSNDEYHYRWWGLYKVQKDMYANNSSVGSLMISSKQWGKIMTFTGYGSTTRATDTYTTRPDLSGSAYATDSTQYDVSKNIYDLAGNLCEWTMTASGAYGRYYRGGSQGYYYYPASSYAAGSPNSNATTSYR